MVVLAVVIGGVLVVTLAYRRAKTEPSAGRPLWGFALVTGASVAVASGIIAAWLRTADDWTWLSLMAMAAIAAAVIGTAQWRYLRKLLPVKWTWILTALPAAIIVVLNVMAGVGADDVGLGGMWFAAFILLLLFALPVFGPLHGLAQCLALRRSIRFRLLAGLAIWTIGGLAGVVAAEIGFAIIFGIGLGIITPRSGFAEPNEVLTLPLLILAMAVFGLIIGGTSTLLIHGTRQAAPASAAPAAAAAA